MFGFQEMSQLLKEMGNVSVAINGFESPARPFKNNKLASKKKTDWNKMLKKQQIRRGE